MKIIADGVYRDMTQEEEADWENRKNHSPKPALSPTEQIKALTARVASVEDFIFHGLKK